MELWDDGIGVDQGELPLLSNNQLILEGGGGVYKIKPFFNAMQTPPPSPKCD